MPRINRPLLHDTPGRGHRFYWIEDNGDGTVDVYLSPVVCKYSTDLGVSEYVSLLQTSSISFTFPTAVL